MTANPAPGAKTREKRTPLEGGVRKLRIYGALLRSRRCLRPAPVYLPRLAQPVCDAYHNCKKVFDGRPKGSALCPQRMASSFVSGQDVCRGFPAVRWCGDLEAATTIKFFRRSQPSLAILERTLDFFAGRCERSQPTITAPDLVANHSLGYFLDLHSRAPHAPRAYNYPTSHSQSVTHITTAERFLMDGGEVSDCARRCAPHGGTSQSGTH